MQAKTNKRATQKPKVESGDTLSNVLRRQIADDILDGRRLPGSRLDERALAEEYGVSRTPVREALQQLVSAGLAASKPRSGAVVQEVAPGRVASLCEASILLESLCARLAAARITAVELGRLRRIHQACDSYHQSSDFSGYALENRKFHSAIISATQNQDLEAAVESFRLRIAPYQRTPFRSSARRQASQNEHEKIIEALEAGDAERANQTMTEHLKAAAVAIDEQLRSS